jgi:hypothetical protein
MHVRHILRLSTPRIPENERSRASLSEGRHNFRRHDKSHMHFCVAEQRTARVLCLEYCVVSQGALSLSRQSDGGGRLPSPPDLAAALICSDPIRA